MLSERYTCATSDVSNSAWPHVACEVWPSLSLSYILEVRVDVSIAAIHTLSRTFVIFVKHQTLQLWNYEECCFVIIFNIGLSHTGSLNLEPGLRHTGTESLNHGPGLRISVSKIKDQTSGYP